MSDVKNTEEQHEETAHSESNADKVQEELRDSVHKVWLAGLGAVALAEEKGGEFFKGLVERGEGFEAQGKERLDEVRGKVNEARTKAKDQATSTFDKVEERVDDAVNSAMRRMGVPGRDEIATLTKRVEELTRVVEQLRPTPAAGADESAAEAKAN